MKTYRETYIRRAEIAQLIILHQIYRQTGSRDLIFQGGTAIRWCYGGTRFSEDLDFVTPLAAEAVRVKLEKTLPGIERTMIPHFGIGSLTMTEKSARTEALKCSMEFRPENSREKISVKLELEGISGNMKPELTNQVLSALPTVSYLIAVGEFRVPQAHAVVVAETPAEILSDKVRSLLERRYLKGRDLFDVWYLRSVLNAPVNKEIVEKKFRMYRAPFNARRDKDYFA
ncbi:MAG: nucleotidyl transferase AbiEii/AbiGii toxin family protein, partial [Syntrophales bacterium LBB04]|nr:nucleotidyl transferase AbiEii/AbiGii toxin family protein [Syntrophales bacterium LBB04]